MLAGTVILLRGPAPRAEPPPAAPSVPVTAVHVTSRNVPVYLTGLGQVMALQNVAVKSQVSGMLMETPFTEGEEVKTGAVLALIDPRPYQAALDGAAAKQAEDQAQLANARADLARYTTLAAKDFASRQQLDTQQALVRRFTATLQADAAAIEAARLNLEFTRITSPIAGRVGLREVDPGNLVQANAPSGIVTVTQMRPISVLFTLPQADVARIRAAAAKAPLPVLATSEDGAHVLDRGELRTMDNAIDPSTGTIRLKAVFPNANETLWPGAFVNARLLVETLHEVPTLPAHAVQRGPDGLYVYLIKPDRTVVREPVKEASEEEGLAIIASGLAPGAEVVLSGQARLKNGTRVAVVQPTTGS